MLNHLNERIQVLFLVAFALLLTALPALADGPAVPAGSTTAVNASALGAPQAPSIFGSALPLILMFGVVYFLMLRPQQKKMKEQQKMLTELKHGDEVITASGMLGTVTGITDKVVTLEVARDVRVKMLKSQVSQVLKGPLTDSVTT